MSDLPQINSMTKDEVMAELSARGIVFDRKQRVDELRQLLINKGSKTGNTVKKIADVKYLRNPKTGRVFEATPALLLMGNLEPVKD